MTRCEKWLSKTDKTVLVQLYHLLNIYMLAIQIYECSCRIIPYEYTSMSCQHQLLDTVWWNQPIKYNYKKDLRLIIWILYLGKRKYFLRPEVSMMMMMMFAVPEKSP